MELLGLKKSTLTNVPRFSNQLGSSIPCSYWIFPPIISSFFFNTRALSAKKQLYSRLQRDIYKTEEKLITRIFFSEEVCLDLNLLMYIMERKSFYLTCVTRVSRKDFIKFFMWKGLCISNKLKFIEPTDFKITLQIHRDTPKLFLI